MSDNKMDLNDKELSLDELDDVVGGRPHWGFIGFKDWLVKRAFSCPNCGKTFSYDAYEKNGNACPFCYPKDQSYMM